MKKIIILAILALSLGVGVFFYQQSKSSKLLTTPHVVTPKLDISQAPFDVVSLKNVIGDATTTAINTGNKLINQVTGNQGEPVINQAIDNLQTELKNIPEQQFEKAKYEFCQGVIKEYESKQ